MTDLDDWLVRYEASHSDLRNPIVFWAAVPLAIIGFTGLLWTTSVPDEFRQISPLLNWGSAFLMVSAIYYFIISLSLAVGLLPFLLGIASIHLWLAASEFSAVAVWSGCLAAGIVGIALGRGPSVRAFFNDLQLLMIGPAWLLSILFKRFGIPV